MHISDTESFQILGIIYEVEAELQNGTFENHENELENLDVFYVYRLLSVGLMVGDDVEYMVFGCTRFIAKIVIENQVINFFPLKFDILKKEINEIYVTYRSTIP